DIYSLGVVGYQMLAGRTPFRASNTPAMLVKHISETPHPVESLRPDVPPALAQAVMRALAKKPEDRWSDAAEFRTAILDTRPPAPADASETNHRTNRDAQPAREEQPVPPAAAAPPAFYQSPFTGPANAPPRPSQPAEAVGHVPALPPMPAMPA